MSTYYVYILEANGMYKVGITKDINTRIATLQTGNPYKINKVETYPCMTINIARMVEAEIHEQYTNSRLVGEWFSCELIALKNTIINVIAEYQIDDKIVILDRSCIIKAYTKKANAILDEQRSITKQCNGNVLPAYLYNYYVSICQIPSWDLTNDGAIAKQLGVSERKIADTRRLLTKMGWVRLDTHKHNGITYGMWYIGKEVVVAKFGVDTTIEEYIALGIVTVEEIAAIEDGLGNAEERI